MRVPTTPTDGLFLKFFVLKIDGSDEAALKALAMYILVKKNPALTRDVLRHLKAIGQTDMANGLLKLPVIQQQIKKK